MTGLPKNLLTDAATGLRICALARKAAPAQ
jgi:hypothetical protein